MPLISVIVSVYNGEKTILETLDSVLNQTLKDFEIIVVNDGSQDETEAVVKKIDDPRIQLYSHQNSGQAASNNWGLSLSSGEYIAFLDADDLWTPDKLEAQYRALQEHPEAGVAYSWTDQIDESSQFLRGGPHVTVNGDALAMLLLGDFIGSGSNALIRRRALDEVGNFEVSLAPVADWDLWLRLAARYAYVVVPKVQILYRQCRTSVTSNVYKMEDVSWKTIERAIANNPDKLSHLKNKCLGNRYKGLTWKALEGEPTQYKGIAAARFLWNAIIRDPVLLQDRDIWKVWFKIAVWTLLHPDRARTLISQYNTLPEIHTSLLMHFRMNP